MPRNIDNDLLAHYDGEALTLATCVRIERPDNVIIGLTTHDSELIINDELFTPMDSIQSSAMRQTSTTGIDTLDVIGILSSERITETDIIAGRYDNAEILIFQVNYMDVEMGSVVLLRASFGEIKLIEGQFTAEIRGLSQLLKQYIGDVTSASCRVKRLGDAQCKADVESFRQNRTIDSIVSSIEFTVADSNPNDYYMYGLVYSLDGPNSGLIREIKSNVFNGGSNTIILRSAFPFPFTEGSNVILEAGCDRRLETCVHKFDNAVNFHAEPHIPGNDRIVQIGRHPG